MRQLNGYRPSHKNRWLFIKNGVLDIQEFSLLEFYIDIVGFDKRHQDFGLFEIDFKELQEVFRKSENTVRNWHNKLLQTGFIQHTNKKLIYRLTCTERYVSPGKWKGKADYYQEIEKNQPIGKILQNFGVQVQLIAQKTQPIEKQEDKKLEPTTQSNSKALLSSNNSLVSSSPSSFPKVVIINQDMVKTPEEYEKIAQDAGFTRLSKEDMHWIDQNVSEKINVENEEQEKEIIRVYFDDDVEKYNSHVVK